MPQILMMKLMKKMLNKFKKENNPDGEINFFAVDPNIKGKGIGTLLLNELEKQEKGKLIYLFTDNGSTYQFYTHRGFKESSRTDIKLEINKKEIDLTCFLYSKIIGERAKRRITGLFTLRA
jgi:GNAT superfamily N-acetyltransferase